MDNKGFKYYLGIDVGSTTVKVVLVERESDKIIYKDYQRHETKQAEKLYDLLTRLESECEVNKDDVRVYITGSGGGNLADSLGAVFVQEVNAVSLCVEKLYPDAGSVVELGGQDAKIIVFKTIDDSGKKKKIPSMNDKCAGGTGSVIDKISAKLKIPTEQLSQMGYLNYNLHPVAGKCGVFAETDINGLQKAGVPANELMASLFEAIIGQNLSVLTRGNTLLPKCLLLGGPNTFIKGMVEAWKHHIPKIWAERKIQLPEGVPPEDLIIVPKNAEYFAAIGAIEFGKEDDERNISYNGAIALQDFLKQDLSAIKKEQGGPGLSNSENELEEFIKAYTIPTFKAASITKGTVVKGFLGIDGGSTSTKAVIVNKEGEILFKSYQLSKGNPIEDTIEVIGNLQTQVEAQGGVLDILGVGTTGYAKDVLKDVLGADVALVETVAHTQSALHFYKDADVICDVGGQDIKIIMLKNGQVKDFRLNTQCSAGNGYFLQGTAASFGIDIRHYAATAFKADVSPIFGYGCAVFMQSDIVNFQRQNWTPAEIMAGLAIVLPKNIWLYVAQMPNLSRLGTTFILQGGTQYNLAAVKSQVDFIKSRFVGKDVEPVVRVHEHTGESGAIGSALEALRIWKQGHKTEFIGLTAVKNITYSTTSDESTRCYFCKNHCIRTFIDVKTVSRKLFEIESIVDKEPELIEAEHHHDKVVSMQINLDNIDELKSKSKKIVGA